MSINSWGHDDMLKTLFLTQEVSAVRAILHIALREKDRVFCSVLGLLNLIDTKID